jgi:hypothetical protein
LNLDFGFWIFDLGRGASGGAGRSSACSFNQKSKFKNQESHIKWASEEADVLDRLEIGGCIGWNDF